MSAMVSGCNCQEVIMIGKNSDGCLSTRGRIEDASPKGASLSADLPFVALKVRRTYEPL